MKKGIFLIITLLFVTVISKGQFKNVKGNDKIAVPSIVKFDVQTSGPISSLDAPSIANGNGYSPAWFGNKENRFTTLLAGYAAAEGESGIHLEAARIIQPQSVGFGAYMSYIRMPKVNYSNWTIAGLQLRAGAKEGEIKPYGVFDFGLFNLTYSNEDLTFRTGTVDLGGGIEKSIGEKSSFLLDFRWKRFFDYKGERDGFSMWTFNAGIKF